MSNWWWYALIIALVVVGVMVFMRMRRNQAHGQHPDLGSDDSIPRDYSQEREDLRSSNLSAEDQAWETASLQRERDSRTKAPPADEA
ncbi:MAG TPA: hypothetical protein VEW66_08775 [Thermomicrobiales bacterium]|nr:hypothetical protein [Thermomicrobiales bacterium]